MIIVTSTVTEEPPPEEPPPGARQGLRLVLTGSDNSSWNLASGEVRVRSGVRLGTAEPEHRTKVAATLDGTAWQSSRSPGIQTFLPVYMTTASSLGLRDLDSEFAAAVSGEVVLTVTTPDAKFRTLPTRYTSGLDAASDIDPLLWRHSTYGLTFDSESAYWHGARRSVEFLVADDEPMFPGPPFAINPTNTTHDAFVDNPGDVATWPRWTITGPVDGFTVGVGSSVVVFDAPILADDGVVVDMDPRVNDVTGLYGQDRWLDVTEASFSPVPPGTGIPLALDVEQPGDGAAVLLEFTPLYRRAW